MKPTKFDSFYSWIVLPVYVWQGLGVRRKTNPDRMAPPKPKRLIELKGKGTPLRVMMIGDSSAAGVGVENFEECVAGRLPDLLSEKTGRPITMTSSGHNSATTVDMRLDIIPNLSHRELDYIVINIGTNDAKNFFSGRKFSKNFSAMIYALQAKFPEAQLIWSGIIDLEDVPVLPTPLNKIIGTRARILREIANGVCYERGVLAPKSNWQPLPENFAKDGFHASSEGYRMWAEELSEFLADLEAK